MFSSEAVRFEELGTALGVDRYDENRCSLWDVGLSRKEATTDAVRRGGCP